MHTRTLTHTHTQAHTHAHAHTCTRTHIHTHIHTHAHTGHCKTIEFAFDMAEDTADAIAGEMMDDLSLSKLEADVIAVKITQELRR